MRKKTLIILSIIGLMLNAKAQPFSFFAFHSARAAIAWKTNIYYINGQYILVPYFYISNPFRVIPAGKVYSNSLESERAYDSISRRPEFQRGSPGISIDSILVKVDSGLYKAVVPCAGSCNHLALYNRKTDVWHNDKILFTRYDDTSEQISHTYYFDETPVPQMSFYENGAIIICEYTTDSGKWYGELSKENTVRNTWKINSKDTIITEVKYGNDLLNPPFYPGYSVLPTGTWTFVPSFPRSMKRFYKLSYLPIKNEIEIGNKRRAFKLNLTALNGE